MCAVLRANKSLGCPTGVGPERMGSLGSPTRHTPLGPDRSVACTVKISRTLPRPQRVTIMRLLMRLRPVSHSRIRAYGIGMVWSCSCLIRANLFSGVAYEATFDRALWSSLVSAPARVPERTAGRWSRALRSAQQFIPGHQDLGRALSQPGYALPRNKGKRRDRDLVSGRSVRVRSGDVGSGLGHRCRPGAWASERGIGRRVHALHLRRDRDGEQRPASELYRCHSHLELWRWTSARPRIRPFRQRRGSLSPPGCGCDPSRLPVCSRIGVPDRPWIPFRRTEVEIDGILPASEIGYAATSAATEPDQHPDNLAGQQHLFPRRGKAGGSDRGAVYRDAVQVRRDLTPNRLRLLWLCSVCL